MMATRYWSNTLSVMSGRPNVSPRLKVFQSLESRLQPALRQRAEMITERITSVIADLGSISDEAGLMFGTLTGPQLNWKSSQKTWSVAQCLEHLITINSLYFPVFEKMRSGGVSNTFWEKHSPLSGFFGRYLIKASGPENPKKMKTSKKAYPSASEIGSDIVVRFQEHNKELAGHIGAISHDVDLKTIITSPLAGFVTYSLDDCLTILVVHERRHLLQAKRVMESFE